MEPKDSIQIEVAYVTNLAQRIVQLTVPRNTTAGDAVKLSEIQDYFPEINFDTAPIGVFGKLVARDHLLTNDDRVEIYLKLKQTPGEARIRRAENRKKKSTLTFY